MRRLLSGTWQIADALYNQGFLSYPRTETDKFKISDGELRDLVQEQTNSEVWGAYAQQ